MIVYRVDGDKMLPPDVNRILTTRIRTQIIKPLNDLVEWDRYGIREKDDSGFIFGWIRREDGLLDFVVVRFLLVNEGGINFAISYDTSSRKYSREIGERLGMGPENYLECQPASDFEGANLIKWQKMDD